MPDDPNTPDSRLHWIAGLILVLAGAWALWDGLVLGEDREAAAAPVAQAATTRGADAVLMELDRAEPRTTVEDAAPETPERAAVELPSDERAKLLAAMHLRVRVETPSGAPIPGLVLHNGGSSWGDNFDFTTDTFGEVTLPRPRTRGGFEHLDRRLTFDEWRKFPLSKARLEGEVFVLTMDDVEMFAIELVDTAGRSTYGERGLELRADAPASVLADSERLSGSTGDASGQRSARIVLRGSGPLPVLRGVRDVHWRDERQVKGGKEGWLRAPVPGSVEQPATWRMELLDPGYLLRGVLVGVRHEWELQCALGLSGGIELTKVDLDPDGRFELRVGAVPRGFGGRPPRLDHIHFAARSAEDGRTRSFARALDPGLPPGTHDVGRLSADSAPLLARGRVVNEDGLPVSGATVRLVDGRSLERRGRSLTSSLGIYANDGWWSSSTGIDGQFEIRGSTSLERPVLVAEHEELRVLKNASLSVIGGSYELVLAAPRGAGFSWRYAATSERSGQLQLEFRRLEEGPEEGLLFSVSVSPGAYGFPLVPGTYELSLREGRGGLELLKARGVVPQLNLSLGSTFDPNLANDCEIEGWEDLVIE